MNEGIQHETKKIMDEIETLSADGDYIYRGEPRCYETVSSTLYRQYVNEIAAEHFNIETVQAEILSAAKIYVYETDDLEILTQLQHYGGNTNLIDFTTDYLIALFFACNGRHDRCGRVILLDKTNVPQDQIVIPRSQINRVRDQKSVFFQPPTGFIEPGQYKQITIHNHLKQPMLDHLKKYHGLSPQVIYNDIHGFIKVQSLHKSAYTEFYKGFTCQNRGDETTNPEEQRRWYEKAVRHYTQSERFDRNDPVTYNNRGLAHSKLWDDNNAIKDYTHAIEFNLNYPDPYNNRGVVYLRQRRFDCAINDFTRAIEHNYVRAYYNRGLARLCLTEWAGARLDLATAEANGIDVVNEFNKSGNVEHFQSSWGITLPSDIAEMLTRP